jgi:Tfp pilus assembly protein PilW
MCARNRGAAEPRRAAARRGQAGFTLTETLVASVVGLLAISAFASFHVVQMYGMMNQVSQVDLQNSARAIVDLFGTEARRAGAGTNPTCTGTVSTGVLVAKSSTVRFRADLDSNGSLTGSNEDVTYTIDSTNNQITRTDNGASRTDTLWSGNSVSGSQILYYDVNGTQLVPSSSGLSAAELLQVFRMKLQLKLTGATVQQGTSTTQKAVESADAELRNRYFVSPTPYCRYN